MKSRPTKNKIIVMTIISFLLVLFLYIFMIRIYKNIIYSPDRPEDTRGIGIILILMMIPIGAFMFWNIGLNISFIIYTAVDLRKAVVNKTTKKVPLILMILNIILFISDVGFFLMLSYNKYLFG